MALERVKGRRDTVLDWQVCVNVAHPLNSALNINACKWTVTEHMLLSREALDMGNDTDRDSGMQGQRISLVVNVAYMHHWAKPSQTVIRRSAIWRWPLAYSGEGLCHMRCDVSYPTAVPQRSRVYQDYFCHVESLMRPYNVDKSLTPTSKCTLTLLPPPFPFFPYLRLPHGP